MTSPLYLRDLATRIRSKATPAARATAERLLEIATELDTLNSLGRAPGAPGRPSGPSPAAGRESELEYAGSVAGEGRSPSRAPPRDLTLGTNRKLADLRRAQNMPAPTLEELKALRAEIAAGGDRQK